MRSTCSLVFKRKHIVIVSSCHFQQAISMWYFLLWPSAARSEQRTGDRACDDEDKNGSPADWLTDRDSLGVYGRVMTTRTLAQHTGRVVVLCYCSNELQAPSLHRVWSPTHWLRRGATCWAVCRTSVSSRRRHSTSTLRSIVRPRCLQDDDDAAILH